MLRLHSLFLRLHSCLWGNNASVDFCGLGRTLSYGVQNLKKGGVFGSFLTPYGGNNLAVSEWAATEASNLVVVWKIGEMVQKWMDDWTIGEQEEEEGLVDSSKR